MQRIDDPEQLKSLSLSPDEYQQIFDDLVTQPFASLEKAKAFWTDESVCLFHFSSHDTIDNNLDKQTAQTITTIDPEYVGNICESLCLALFVTTDSGSGFYLLFPKTTQCPRLRLLNQQAS